MFSPKNDKVEIFTHNSEFFRSIFLTLCVRGKSRKNVIFAMKSSAMIRKNHAHITIYTCHDFLWNSLLNE